MIPIDLQGKKALVTGASRKIGIGAATTRALARAGADVFITYYRPYDASMAWGSKPEEVDGLLAELRGLGVKAEGVEADLADPDIPARLIEMAFTTLGGLDILVNNACHDVETDLMATSASALDRHYAVNLRAPLLLSQEFARRFTAGQGGRIVNLTTGQALGPMDDNLPYAVTKAAVEGLATNAAPTLAKLGITINAVDPGPTDTGWMSPEWKVELARRTPSGRVGEPEDVANLILFLCSEQGGWVTGQVIHSNGGFR